MKNIFEEKDLKIFAENNKNARTYKNGLRYTSKNYGDFIIIGRRHREGRGSTILVQFVDTGNIVETNSSNIRSGYIKDKLRPSICNIGYIGIGSYTVEENREFYNRWSGMLSRCYDEDIQKKHPTYIGCSVDESWHNFQNYARDIEELMKEKGIVSLDGYGIDKDIKIPGNKVYSKETVSIVTLYENSIKDIINRKVLTGLKYIGTRISDVYEEEFVNQSEFARKYNLCSKNVNQCILGKKHTHKGWVFRKA